MLIAHAELTRLRTQLEQNTRNAVTFADKSAEQQQHSSGDGMLNAVQSIQDAVDVSVTKVLRTACKADCIYAFVALR